MDGDDQPVDERELERTRKMTMPIRGWKLRFDAPPLEGDGWSRLAEEDDIIALFRAWQETDPGDRRVSPRYVPAETRVWVGWWMGPRFFVTLAALVNLSKGGALVHLGNRPPISQPVWVCIGSPHPLDYVQARVLAAAPETVDVTVGEFVARLEFHTPAPPSFFLAAGRRDEDNAPRA